MFRCLARLWHHPTAFNRSVANGTRKVIILTFVPIGPFDLRQRASDCLWAPMLD